MAKYVTFVKFKDETFARMIDNPRPAVDRVAVITNALQQVGGQVDAYYWMLGPHDSMVISDIPDSTSAAGAMIAVNSTGAFESVEAHELFVVDQLSGILGKANAVRGVYTRPGA